MKRKVLLRGIHVCIVMCLVVCTVKAQESVLEVVYDATTPSCYGDANGTVWFSIEGGEPPYEYRWSSVSNAFVFASGEVDAEQTWVELSHELPAAAYVIQLQDANGELLTDTVELQNPPQMLLTDIQIESASCAQACDGFIELGFIGGVGDLTISWNDSDIIAANRYELCAGEYIFYVDDENGCSQLGAFDIEAPPAIELSAELTPPTCEGATNGAIEGNAIGGSGEYEWQWGNTEQTNILNDIGEGVYHLTVTDEVGCTEDIIINLPDGPTLTPNVQVNDGCGDGAIIISAQPINGALPYTYTWSTGTNQTTLYQMNSGEYALTLTDANGCVGESDFVVEYVEPLEVEVELQDVVCAGRDDGAVSLNVSGGRMPYSLLWTTGDSGYSLMNLAAGTYGFNLVSGGCGLARSVVVNEPQEISVEVDFLLQTDGYLSAMAWVSGGTAPYYLEWNDGQQGYVASRILPMNAYSLMVRDAEGCEVIIEGTALVSVSYEVAVKSVSVYPNPSFGDQWVCLPPIGNRQETARFRLYSTSGQLVKQGTWLPTQEWILDTPKISGVYILEVETPSTYLTAHLVRA